MNRVAPIDAQGCYFVDEICFIDCFLDFLMLKCCSFGAYKIHILPLRHFLKTVQKRSDCCGLI